MTTPATKETVIVVHGTFSGTRTDGSASWYAPGEAFCQQLDAALANAQSGARCWQHLQPGEEHFRWDGRNDWMSRRNATARLRQLLLRLHAEKWRVHLVGHSHGGNVIIDAITDDEGRVERWFRGRVALLGTPLYRDAAEFSVRKRSLTKHWLAWSVLSWGILVYLAARGVDVEAAFAIGSRTEFWASAVAFVGVVFLLMSLYRLLKASTLGIHAAINWYETGGLDRSKGEMRWSPAFLCINSGADEAMKSLTGLPEAKDPPALLTDSPATRSFFTNLLAVIESSRVHLTTVVANTLNTRHTTALAAIGLAFVLVPVLWKATLAGRLSNSGDALMFWTFLSGFIVTVWFFSPLFFFPGVVISQGLSTLSRGITGLTALTFDGTIKHWVWRFTRALSLGMSGAPRRIQDVSVQRMLTSRDAEDCVYLELPDDIVKGVQQSQRDRFARIQEILYEKTENWLPTQLRAHLETVDFPLVHTVYYRDSSCIQKVADWLLEPMKDFFDGRIKTPTTVSHGSFRGGQFQTLEDFEGANHYRAHLEELKLKHGAPASRWGQATNFDKLSVLRSAH